MYPLRIQIVVGGRFHADHMASALVKAGHQVEVITSLPRSRFPELSKAQVKSFILPELISRGFAKVGFGNLGELCKTRLFAARAAKYLKKQNSPLDVFIGWSSFSKESLDAVQAKRKIIVRGSAHICYQDRLLREEYARQRLRYPDRSSIIARELAEYEKADHIILLSQFSKDTFVAEGVDAKKLQHFWLGVDTSLFSARTVRPETGPLKVVYFGLQSVRKGVPYLLEATKEFSPRELELTLIGDIEPGLEKVFRQYSHAKLLPSMGQRELNTLLQKMEVFVLPTLEDGFSQSLLQAMAAGLAPIVTSNAGCAELVESGQSGFVVPIRDPASIRENLVKWIRSPELLASMRQQASQVRANHTWDTYGENLTKWIAEIASSSNQAHSNLRQV